MKPNGLSFVADFLSTSEQEDVVSAVRSLDYAHDSFRGKRLRRAYAQFGYAYKSTGRRLETASAFPDFLAALRRRVLDRCEPGTHFDQCIITRYPPGAGIGWHTDAPRFGECVAGISLGSAATLQFRPNGSQAGTYELNADPGSLYTFVGEARWHYQHQVLALQAERYSLTFRSVREATPN